MSDEWEWNKEDREGWGCIAWIAAVLVIPALIGWGVSSWLSKISSASKYATGVGIAVGLVFLVLAIALSVWYANRRGWLDAKSLEGEDMY